MLPREVGSPTMTRSSAWCCAGTVSSCPSAPRKGGPAGRKGLIETAADPGWSGDDPGRQGIDWHPSPSCGLRERPESLASSPMFGKRGSRLRLRWEEFDFAGRAERNEHDHRLMACAARPRAPPSGTTYRDMRRRLAACARRRLSGWRRLMGDSDPGLYYPVIV
jgi:hypothetical protein